MYWRPSRHPGGENEEIKVLAQRCDGKLLLATGACFKRSGHFLMKGRAKSDTGGFSQRNLRLALKGLYLNIISHGPPPGNDVCQGSPITPTDSLTLPTCLAATDEI